MKQLISIIVPVYKVEKYLERCIDSIIKQTYPYFELILVDDGSPDECPQICDNYAKQDKRIKVLHLQNGGVSNARNQGLNIATGEFIMFVDSDDFIHIDCLEKLVNQQNKHDSDIVRCNYYEYYNDEIIIPYKDNEFKKFMTSKDYSLFFKMPCAVWRSIYKKSILEKIRFSTHLKIAEDTEFFIKAVKNAKKLDFCEDSLYYYFINQNSVMNSIKEGFADNIQNGINSCIKLLENDVTQNHIYAYEYKIYISAFSEYLNTNNKIKFKEYEKNYNDKKRYKQYIKFYNVRSFKERIKLFLAHNKCFSLYKLLKKI